MNSVEGPGQKRQEEQLERLRKDQSSNIGVKKKVLGDEIGKE